jgi:hypothetical protein
MTDSGRKPRKLYLDDIRKAPDETWIIVRNFEAFANWIEANGLPDVVSFDHDLGHGQAYRKPRGKRIWIPRAEFEQIKDGYDCCKWMLENYGMPKEARVHSMNPVGAERLRNLLSDYWKGSCHEAK